ncbi:MAG TPA: DUF2818 family protein [Oxalicibacterium sp.]|nr:DUF2818 family protein [Oxalicibacterium sp.]
MNVSLVSWFVILLALFGANLPFFNERLFALVPLSRPVKPVWMRLVELLLLYLLVGLAARLLEARIGSVFPQGWEFFAITGCLFLVFAYPGFVLRYLRKRRG